MRFAASVVSTLALVGSALAQAALTVNTPTALVECEPTALTFSGGTVLPGGQTTAAALVTLPTQAAAGTYTWTVNIASGTAVTIAVKDATGTINYTSQLTIQAGSSSCLSSSAGSTTSGAATTSSAAATGTTSAPASTSATSAANKVTGGSVVALALTALVALFA
ncbi:hypothetical protein MNV49_007464 [Pseudohyphozyma bogoriensis]|nr:hypothetical protein MNV49_007464 [Pseudohyphozyma bogoriensis]